MEKSYTVMHGKSIMKYDPDRSNKFQHLADLPEDCYCSSIVAVGTFIYMLGGLDSLSDIHVYNSMKNEWILIEDVLKDLRQSAAAVAIGKKVIVSGGYLTTHGDYVRPLSSVEVFSVEGEACKPVEDHGIPDLQHARWYHAVVAIEDTMYSMGGVGDRDETVTCCECVNVTSCTPFTIPPMNESRSCFSAATYRDTIFVSGGVEEYGEHTLSVETYSPSTNSWTQLNPMKLIRYCHGSMIYNQGLFLIGGWGTHNIERVDLETGKREVYNESMDLTTNSDTHVVLVDYKVTPDDSFPETAESKSYLKFIKLPKYINFNALYPN